MRLHFVAALLAVVVTALLAARLVEHERCEAARTDVRAASFEGQRGAAEQDAAVDRVREHCRGAGALAASAGSLSSAGRPAAAIELAREATRQEPDSALTWQVLVAVAGRVSPADTAEARRRLRALDPRGDGAVGS